MGPMLIWPGFSSVTCTLLSYGLVMGQHAQNALISLLVHSSRFDRHGITGSPLKPSAQFLHTTGRAVPAMAHGGLIGDASTFAAAEKPCTVLLTSIPRIEDARRAVAFAAQEDQVSTAKMRFPPVTDNDLPYRVSRFATGKSAGKFQHQPLCIRATGGLKIDGPEQKTSGAKL